MTTTPAEEVTVYCPRCDRPYKGPRKREAMATMEAHLKEAHPDYYEAMKASE